MVREAHVAGTFYPGARNEIEGVLNGFEKSLRGFSPGFERVFGAVVPHAGWVYSGLTAMHSYLALKKCAGREKPCFVIICPNHTGLGMPVSMSSVDWETPLGVAECEKKLVEEIARHSEYVSLDEESHRFEHSAEVQIPFLQHFFKEFSFAAIALGHQGIEVAGDLGKALWKASEKKKFFVVASSDFTHYEPAAQAREKDLRAIEFIKKLDAHGFVKEVEERRLSICGYGAVAVACIYSKLAGAKKGELLHFTNSGKATGEESVVDYAALVFI